MRRGFSFLLLRLLLFNEDTMSHSTNAPRPNLQVAARVEELLREQLEELGVNPRKLAPEEIAANMHCHLAPNGSMTYLWKGEPMLHVTPEKLVDVMAEYSSRRKLDLETSLFLVLFYRIRRRVRNFFKRRLKEIRTRTNEKIEDKKAAAMEK